MTADFRSDNVTAVSPEILEALSAVNAGTADAYGDDEVSASLDARFAEVFGTDVAVFPVGTGTAANALAISALCPPWGVVYCHLQAHARVDEAGAPELFTGGARVEGLPGDGAKLTPGVLAAAVQAAAPHGPHNMPAAAVSLSQATELGCVYTPDETIALCGAAHGFGLGVHMDGARFANAVAATGARPAELTWRAGVDVLSFGATKNGAMAAEAVVFFRRDLAAAFDLRRKRAGQLFSKQRNVAAQLAAYLHGDLWLRNAGHANAQAARLADGLRSLPGAEIVLPVEANEVFVRLPEATAAGLAERGFRFHPWDHALGSGAVRLVTAWNTEPAGVDAFLTAARALGAP